MKLIRKKLSILIISILLSMSYSSANADTNSIIYDMTTKETITSGVTHEEILRFTDDGWLNINVLRIDLDNKNVRVDTLSNNETLQKLINVKDLVESNGAVAAVNGSFFNWMTESGYGYADGPVVQSGKIISSDREYNRYNDSMGTFSISNLNEAMFTFWKTDMEVVAPNGTKATVFKFNKPNHDNFNTIAVYDRKWTKNSPGASPENPSLVEMVVNQNAVVEIRRGLPSIEIPKNGYVVVANGDNANFLANNFRVGDLVSLEISTTPDWSRTKMAVTGSAILLENGQVPTKFSYVSGGINTKSPRTAVGSSRSGKELLLVTVDGRQNSSLGMTLTETANLMIDLGAYNALNLDGGGSTTMVAREPGKNTINIVNNPSDGYPRRVSTAIGVFSTFPTGDLDGFIIDTIDTNVFVDTSRKFSVSGYDKYFNPVEIEEDDIEWSVEGVEGEFIDNTFFPKTEGEGTITATIGKVSSSIKINVLENPTKLILSTKTLKIIKDNTYSFTVQGIDKNGFTTSINADDVNWSTDDNIGSISGSVFTAKNTGVGIIDAYLGDIHSYCAVSVGEEYSFLMDDFESPNGTFTSLPSGTPGSYEISDKVRLEGESSGKLSYDFSNLEGTRAAYLVYNNDGLIIDESVTKIGLWVYNPRENSNWLRTELYDANGQKKMLNFVTNMDWSGWNYVETSLSNISLPAQLTKIYTVQVNPVPECGDIYIDNLTFTASTFPEIDKANIPQDIVAEDEANTQIELTELDNVTKFNIFSLEGEPTNLLGKILQTRLTDKSSSDVDTLISLGNASKSLSDSINTQILELDSTYKSISMSGLNILQLNTSNKGLRTSEAGQWQWFLDQLSTVNEKNLFIFMKDSPKDFKDKMEANLFVKVLKEYKQNTESNVWLFYNGDSSECFMENGIRYFCPGTSNLNTLKPDDASNAEYIEVVVKDNIPTFQYKFITQ